MISIVGHFLLIVALVSSVGAILLKKKSKLICFYLGFFAPVIDFCLLVIAFIISDFSLKNVFLNSSSVLPLIYKIAASWASHQGSMLLWLSLLCLVGIAYIYLARFSLALKEFSIMILAFIQILFVSLIIFTSNPFDTFSFIPNEGLGLNPMLQDVALSIHPPLLYLGNVSYVVLFVSGCLLLYRLEEKTQILDVSKKFSSFALVTLTAGIGLGSWWAYRELGWGGFWFFDPVENISLLPWLGGIALHHCLIVSMQNGRFLPWTIAFSLLDFLLTIYGTFIVRSGIISSVHSFAFSPERGAYILSICIILTLLCLIWFIVKVRNLKQSNLAFTSSEIAILIGNIFWLVAIISLVITLVYPIYYLFKFGVEIVIDPEYFISIFVPIFFPILLLAAIAPSITQKKMRWKNLAFMLLSAIFTVGLGSQVEFGMISALMSFAAIYLMFQTTIFLFACSTLLRKYSLFLGHFGFGLLTLSIILNSLLSQEIEFAGEIGDQVSDKNMQVKLENIKFADDINYYRQIAVFSVEDQHGNIITLKPENRLYKVENTLSQEVDIYSFMFHDLYAVLSQINKNTIHAKIYYQPWISFIWLSVFIISSGFLMLLFSKRRSHI